MDLDEQTRQCLQSSGALSADDWAALQAYRPRSGFVFLPAEEAADMRRYLDEFLEQYGDLVPILGDGNSNYWCVYVRGALAGMVCHFDHEEEDLAPRYLNVARLLAAVERQPQCHDFYDLLTAARDYDFPLRAPLPMPQRHDVMRQLQQRLSACEDEVVAKNLAFAIMNLCAADELEAWLYPFLDSEDMWIQERAIELLGLHRYTPARERLRELQHSAQHNGRLAAERALQQLAAPLPSTPENPYEPKKT